MYGKKLCRYKFNKHWGFPAHGQRHWIGCYLPGVTSEKQHRLITCVPVQTPYKMKSSKNQASDPPCRDLYTPTLSHRPMDCPPNDQERPTCDSCARTFASKNHLHGHQRSCKKTIKSKKSQFDRRRHHNNPNRKRNPPPILPPDDVELTSLFKQYDNLCFGGQLQENNVRVAWINFALSGLFERTSGCTWPRYINGRNHILINLSRNHILHRPNNERATTLVHEMIHAHLMIINDEDPPDATGERHGPKFQSIMHRLNQEHGLKMTIDNTFDRVDP